MQFLYFSVMCIGIRQILSGHMVTFDLEVMIDFVFWSPTLSPNTLKWINGQYLTERVQIFCGVFCHELEPI